ncbi:MAG: hypothetical protein LBC70_03350 [Chitinispirillales bacterium]|nr:hypothetical protein [Chitinispirillales bacterium]
MTIAAAGRNDLVQLKIGPDCRVPSQGDCCVCVVKQGVTVPPVTGYRSTVSVYSTEILLPLNPPQSQPENMKSAAAAANVFTLLVKNSISFHSSFPNQ